MSQIEIDYDKPGLVRRDHPDTAREAAALTTTGKVRRRVYGYIYRRGEGGATDDEIIEAGEQAGYTQNALRPRRVELVKSGHVIDSGHKRATRSGRSAIVWVAVGWIESVEVTGDRL